MRVNVYVHALVCVFRGVADSGGGAVADWWSGDGRQHHGMCRSSP